GADEDVGRTGLPLARIVRGEVRLEASAGGVAEGGAEGIAVDVSQVLSAGRVRRVHETVAVEGGGSEAGVQRVRERDVDLAVHVDAVVGAGRDLQVPVGRVVGLPADDVDGTADGVAAEQRALRAAQDLDAVDVDEVQHAANGGGHVHAVHVDA